MRGSEPLGKPPEKRQQEEQKKNPQKTQMFVEATNEGKYVIFNYFWLQSLFLLMHSPNSWLP